MSRVAFRMPRRWNAPHAFVQVAVAVAMGLAGSGAAAQVRAAPPAAPVAMPANAEGQLERAFWACDRAATNAALDSGEAMTCSVVAEEFKKRRFGGDFGAMHAWWQRSRLAQRRALEAADRAAPSR